MSRFDKFLVLVAVVPATARPSCWKQISHRLLRTMCSWCKLCCYVRILWTSGRIIWYRTARSTK